VVEGVCEGIVERSQIAVRYKPEYRERRRK